MKQNKNKIICYIIMQRFIAYLLILKYIIQKQILNPNLEILNNNTYTYDNVGNKLSKQDLTENNNYTYDSTYQLLQVTTPTTNAKGKPIEKKLETYTYDSVGNRLIGPKQNNQYTNNANNQITQIQNPNNQTQNTTYTYDNNGNRYIETETNQDGVTTTTYYSYDYEGRLTKVEIHKDNTVKIITFTYDPFGRRISKTVQKDIVDDNEEPDLLKTIYYVYDNEDIIMEYNQKGKITATYTHGLGIDEPLAFTNKKGETYFYHADALGSIVALSDVNGTVVQTYDYDSFGNMKKKGNIVQPYTFTGREYDPETGLYHYRARTFDQKTGTFISKDSIGFAAGDTNLYRYVGNSPINYTDPFGLICTYSQSSGFTMCTDDTTSKVYYMDFGYSGSMSGYGYNNPDMQGEKSVGPITKGKWKMEDNWYTHPKLGKNTMKLVPLADNECYKTNRSCDTFRMHGDNPKKKGYASEGCIVLPPSRTKIKKGEIIEVIE